MDLIAERIVQYGGVAEGTVRVSAKRSRLLEYLLMIAECRAHVQLCHRRSQISDALLIFKRAI